MAGHDGADGVENVAAGQVERRRDFDARGWFLVPLLVHEIGARQA